MTSKRLTARYFIRKFEQIPLDKWTTGVYYNGESMCALGHCLLFKKGMALETAESRALDRLFGYMDNDYPESCRVASLVNDGMKTLMKDDFCDLGDHPKERILNALCLIDNGLWTEANSVNFYRGY